MSDCQPSGISVYFLVIRKQRTADNNETKIWNQFQFLEDFSRTTWTRNQIKVPGKRRIKGLQKRTDIMNNTHVFGLHNRDHHYIYINLLYYRLLTKISKNPNIRAPKGSWEIRHNVFQRVSIFYVCK